VDGEHRARENPVRKDCPKKCIDNLEFCLGSLLSTAYIPAILLDNGVQVTVNDLASNKITTKSSEKEIIIMGRGYTAATAVFLAIGGKISDPRWDFSLTGCRGFLFGYDSGIISSTIVQPYFEAYMGTPSSS
jgi:hypothetical protein